MNDLVGIIRKEAEMTEALAKIDELKERAPSAIVVQKPINPDELKAAIAEVFSQKPQSGQPAER